jgi:hypothetical protein
LTGTANQVLVDGTSGVAKTGALTLTTPQDIGTASTPYFQRLALGSSTMTRSQLVIWGDSGQADDIASGIWIYAAGPKGLNTCNIYGLRCDAYFTKDAAGVHPLVASGFFGPPADSGPGAATITEAASVYILNAPTCGATNWALKIADGNAYFGGDIDASSTSAIYLGDSTTNGTWKIVRSGNDLIFQRRESGSYVTKGTFSA